MAIPGDPDFDPTAYTYYQVPDGVYIAAPGDPMPTGEFEEMDPDDARAFILAKTGVDIIATREAPASSSREPISFDVTPAAVPTD